MHTLRPRWSSCCSTMLASSSRFAKYQVQSFRACHCRRALPHSQKAPRLVLRITKPSPAMSQFSNVAATNPGLEAGRLGQGKFTAGMRGRRAVLRRRPSRLAHADAAYMPPGTFCTRLLRLRALDLPKQRQALALFRFVLPLSLSALPIGHRLCRWIRWSAQHNDEQQ